MSEILDRMLFQIILTDPIDITVLKSPLNIVSQSTPMNLIISLHKIYQIYIKVHICSHVQDRI